MNTILEWAILHNVPLPLVLMYFIHFDPHTYTTFIMHQHILILCDFFMSNLCSSNVFIHKQVR